MNLLPPNVLKIFFAVLPVALVGCASPQAPISNETAAHIHRIAVISQTANVITRQYTGLTVFGNEKDEKDISNWNVDSEYESQITKEIEKGFGLTVIQAPYSASDFSRVNDLNGPWDAPAFWGPNWEAIEGAAKNYCTANSLDAIIIVAKAKSNDFLAGSNQYIGGLGIYSRGPGNIVSALHLISKVALIDCSTSKPIAVRALAQNQNDLPGAIVRSAPVMTLPVEISRQPISKWTTEQQLQIHNDVVNLPRHTWETTLKSILPSRN